MNKTPVANGLEAAKRLLYLAWKSSPCRGMGILQDNPTATEEEVWEQCMSRGDYPGHGRVPDESGEVYADYVFGRMMKLQFEFGKKFISVPTTNPRGDYQGWSLTYPTYQKLVDATLESLCLSEV